MGKPLGDPGKAAGPALLPAFAVCPSGLETACLREIQALGIAEAGIGKGGVQLRATATELARLNLWCRVPTRILLLLDQVKLRSADDLLSATQKIPWEQWITPTQTFRVDANQGKPPKFPLSLAFAALRVKDGLCDRMRETKGMRPSVDTRSPTHRVWVYIDGEKATISIDLSGEPLFKRGWRLGKGEAPLRENLAAALVAMAQESMGTPLLRGAEGGANAGSEGSPDGGSVGGADGRALLDPMCGSGTLLIEAVAAWAGLAPGFNPIDHRRFSLEDFGPGSPFGRVAMAELRRECMHAWQAAGQKVLPCRVEGRDLDARMVTTAQSNAERALPPHLAAQLRWSIADFATAPPPAPAGVVICNPPYGERLEDTQGPRSMSEAMKQRYVGWTFWLLSDDLKFDSALRLKASQRIPCFNGDLECRWMRFDMVEGSARATPEGSARATSEGSARSDAADPIGSTAEAVQTAGQRLAEVRGAIAQAAAQHGVAPARIELMAVSKTFGPDRVAELLVCGQHHFGENYVQEGVEKIEALSAHRSELVWHFIGPIQSNKTRAVAEHFDWVHSIDRLKIAERLQEQRPAELPPLKVCLQINLDDEESKSGVPVREAEELLAELVLMPRLSLQGLMVIPAPREDLAAQTAAFVQVVRLREQLVARLGPLGVELPWLSMGMSADYPAAIAALASGEASARLMVRVGTALFGARSPRAAQHQN